MRWCQAQGNTAHSVRSNISPLASSQCLCQCTNRTQVHDHLVNTASKSEHGRGGMAAKIGAAWMAAEHGCTTVILNGKKPDGILQVCLRSAISFRVETRV